MGCILVAQSTPKLLRMIQILPLWLLLINILLCKQFCYVSVGLHLQIKFQYKDERIMPCNSNHGSSRSR